MINDAASQLKLPSTAELLIAGGDERLALDAATGRSRYGCLPLPDPELVALGSSTASNISPVAYQAAAELRTRCVHAMRAEPELTVYRRALGHVRRRLLAFCGYGPDDGPMALLAPSGTDLFMLAAHLRQPQCTVLIDGAETGGGVPLALLGPRQGAPHMVAVRHADGSLRDAAQVDAEYAAIVDAAAARGRRVLLVLTDVSKTGLISPGIASVMALKERWPALLDVLVDACQFRIDATTLRAYLAQGFMVALTGSKFMAGPTFSGALLLPRAMASNAVDAVTAERNFGMLLRWEAALAEMEHFAAIPAATRAQAAASFATAVTEALIAAGNPGRAAPKTAAGGTERANAMIAAENPGGADALIAAGNPGSAAHMIAAGSAGRADAMIAAAGARLASVPARAGCVSIAGDHSDGARGRVEFVPLPVATLDRSALGVAPQWDHLQTVFPFTVHTAGRALDAAQTRQLYQQLQQAAPGQRRFHLGQPVGNALRLCLSARMIADHHDAADDIAAALHRISLSCAAY